MTTPTPTKSALLFGATGQVGQKLLSTLLGSAYYAKVGEYGRKVTAADAIGAGKDKLQQGTVDFEKIGSGDLGGQPWDSVFISLGTTRAAAGSAAAFEKIDREYVVNAARAAKSPDAQNTQKLLYVSSTGANSSSSFLYPKSKGMTEEALARLGYSDTIVFRPGFLAGTNRPNHRLAESLFGGFTHLASYFSNSVQIDIGVLARAIVTASRLGSDGLPPQVGATKVTLKDGTSYTVVGNAGCIALANLATE